MEHTQILFPNLHITFEHVGQSISVFGFSIAYYGIIIAIGMLLGGSVVVYHAKKARVREDDILDVILWTLIIGVCGARAYYVIFRWDAYKGDLLSILNLRQGGLGIYGGILCGILTACIVLKKKGIGIPKGLDICILGVPLGQAIGRWGNFFNREAFGDYTENPFAMWIPTDAVHSVADITETMRANLQSLDGVEYISVHPTFLYESLWNLALFSILVFYVFPRRRYDGQVFLTYLLGYGLGRMWIEPLRTDQLLLWNTRVPASLVLSIVLVLISLAVLVYEGRKHRRRRTSGGGQGSHTLADMKRAESRDKIAK